MQSNFHILPCPKCGNTPKVKRHPDPSEMVKRYSLKCGSLDCKFNQEFTAPTETLAIVNWNNGVSRVNIRHTGSEGIIRG